jgi:NhaP-type Na+/H+ or K+/H+ antiporter
LAIGGLLGTAIARLVVYLRREHREALGLDDFLAIGLIALAYGVALLCHTYGFLAVFAAGLALRRAERQNTGAKPPPDVAALAKDEEAASHPEKAPAFLAQAVLEFNEQLERLGEVIVVVVIGALLGPRTLAWEHAWFFAVLFFVIRPVSVELGLLGTEVPQPERRLIAWFGIRGIGSLYYLMYGIEHGLAPETAAQLTALTLTTVAISGVVHGTTVTPLMRFFRERLDENR